MSYALPDLSRFDLRASAIYQTEINLSDAMGAWAYGASFAVAVLALGVIILNRRELH